VACLGLCCTSVLRAGASGSPPDGPRKNITWARVADVQKRNMQRINPRNVEGLVRRGISVWMTRANCELKPGYRNSIKPGPRRCSASRKDIGAPADKTEHGASWR
jgi:hypothetical protein